MYHWFAMNAPGKYISSFWLKIIAILGMTANHLAHAFAWIFPYPVTFILYSFGGLTFPIMAYLIVEGYMHTSNVKKYALRLGIFALVSQIPFTLLFGFKGNIFFTLLIGLLVIWAYDRVKSKLAFVGILIAGVLLSYKMDWALQGPLMIFLFYALKNRGRAGIALTMIVPFAFVIVPVLMTLPQEIIKGMETAANSAIYQLGENIEGAIALLDINGIPLAVTPLAFSQACTLGYAFIGFTIAIIFIMNYNGRRGRSLKWFFYAYYPAHLLIIWGIRTMMRTMLGLS